MTVVAFGCQVPCAIFRWFQPEELTDFRVLHRGIPSRTRERRSVASRKVFALHWPVSDWYSVPANVYLDKRRPEYAREEGRGAIVYRRESGQSGGRVYFSPDCSLTILAVF